MNKTSPLTFLDVLVFFIPVSLLLGERAVFRIHSVPLYCFELLVIILAAFSIRQILARPVYLTASVVTVCLLLLSLVVSTFVAKEPILSLGAVKTWFIFPMIASYIVYCRRELQSALVTGILTLVGAEVLIGLMAFFVSHGDIRAFGSFTSPNHFGALLLLGLAVVIERLAGLPRIVFTGAIIFCIALSQSLGAMIGLAAIGVYLLINKSSGKVRLLGVAALGLLLIFGGWIAVKRFTPVKGTSFESRVQIWRVSANVLHDHWGTGVGLRNFPREYHERVEGVIGVPVQWTAEESHNTLLAFWTNLGILGVLALIVGGYLLFIQSHSLAVRIVVIGILAHGLVDAPIFKFEIAILFWLILALTSGKLKE